MIQGQNISNIQPIQNNINQSSNLANDPELYPTMKKVIEKSKEKVIIDHKNDEQEKLEQEEEKEKEKEKQSIPKSGSISPKLRIDYNRLDEEFKDIFNKGNSNINDTRRNLINFIILTGIVNCIAWEVDCLFLNACYDEYIEMKRWISRSLFPCIIASIILLWILYVSVNFLNKITLITCIIIYALLLVYIFFFGIFSIVKGLKKEIESGIVQNLTKYELQYYKEKTGDDMTEEEAIQNEFKFKMLLSGFLDLIISILGAIVVITTIIFNSYLSQTTFDWRPPLRSHVRISRIKKAIELYTHNSESFINVFRAENPNYQLDEFENKDRDMNRFGRVRGMMEGSLDQSRDKKDYSNSNAQNKNNNIGNDENNGEEEIFLPKARKRKLNNINNEESNKDDKSNIKNGNDKENEINTNSNNLINNKVENNEDIKENNKNDSKEDKKEDNKEDI